MSHDDGAECICVSEHRPAVLEHTHHHIWPMESGGPSVPENMVWLCPTAHYNVHELLRLMVKAGRPLSNYELGALEEHPVSRYAAEIARQGYDRMTRGAL
jgi:hypothetical protein